MQQTAIGGLQSGHISGSQCVGADNVGADGDTVGEIGTQQIDLQQDLMGSQGRHSLLGCLVVGKEKNEAQAGRAQKNVSAVFAKVKPVFFIPREVAPKASNTGHGHNHSEGEKAADQVGQQGSPGRSHKSHLDDIEQKPTGDNIEPRGKGGQEEPHFNPPQPS